MKAESGGNYMIKGWPSGGSTQRGKGRDPTTSDGNTDSLRLTMVDSTMFQLYNGAKAICIQ